MLVYEDAGTPNPISMLLSALGYVETERDMYAHWKSIDYTKGSTTVSFEYSRKAGNLKRVYVNTGGEDWGSVDLHVEAMHFNSHVAKYLPGDTFTEKLTSLLKNPEPYCRAADAERGEGMRRAAAALDAAYSRANRD